MDRENISASSHFDDDLFIVELDTRLELGVPIVTDDLDADFNYASCVNGTCSDGNGGGCMNGVRCS